MRPESLVGIDPVCCLLDGGSTGGDGWWGTAVFGLFPTKTKLKAKEKPLTNQGFPWRSGRDSNPRPPA